jgi:PIN domain nuclease of toxin-antitoxin system
VIYLVDTHILLWYLKGEKKLAENIKKAIENPDHRILVSKASLWEIAIKVSIGKLELHADFDSLENLLVKNKFELLEFDFNDLSELIQLPFHHQDPFDRLLISQARNRKITIISDDNKFKLYDVQLY